MLSEAGRVDAGLTWSRENWFQTLGYLIAKEVETPCVARQFHRAIAAVRALAYRSSSWTR